MSTRTTPWPTGTACWTDNHVPDLGAAQAFYGAVLGWKLDDPDPTMGGYANARLGGREVAGFLGPQDGLPQAWLLYFASDDIDATAAAIAPAGGSVLSGPHDVPGGLGRFLAATDPAGAMFGVWQAGSHLGTRAYGEHGTLGWEDLRSTDPTAAQAFYAAVFGVTLAPLAEAGPDYVLFHLPGDPGAPLGGMGGLNGADGPSHWMPYFVVDDVDAALSAATAHGGTVSMPGMDTPYGRMGGLADPFGSAFWIVAPTGPTPDR